MPRAGFAPNFPIAFARSVGVVAPLVVLAAMAGIATSASAQSLTFISGPTGDQASINRLHGLSADGQSAAGYTAGIGIPGLPGYRWTNGGGREDFGFTLPSALGISGNGQVLVGGSPGTGSIAFRWSQSGGVQTLGTLPGFTDADAIDANFDGSVVVGTNSFNGAGTKQAYRWTPSGGMQGLGLNTTAYGVSGNGNVVIGEFGSAPQGFIWTQAGGRQNLIGLPGGTGATLARGINFDGSIIVGRSGPSTNLPTMWINGVPVELNSNLTSGGFTPNGVSDDGTVVVGQAQAPGGQFAGIWTSTTGVVRLSDYLAMNGVSIPAGVRLFNCTGVSADGRTFAGWTEGSLGIQGYVATIPTPCPADLDNDGLLTNGGTPDHAVTIDDLLFLLTAFESGNLAADLDNGSNTGTRDNAVTIDDLLYFLSHFEAGC